MKNLGLDISVKKLKGHFGKYGPIESCVVMPNSSGTSKGFRFVCFKTASEAIKARDALNGLELADGRKAIRVSMTLRRSDRTSTLSPIDFPGNRHLHPEMNQATTHTGELSVEELEGTVLDEPPSGRKQILGDILFPKVQALHSAKPNKFIRMLLEMDLSDVLEVISNPLSLVTEAIRILVWTGQGGTDEDEMS